MKLTDAEIISLRNEMYASNYLMAYKNRIQDLFHTITDLQAQLAASRREFAIASRVCGNWREFPNTPNIESEKVWQFALRAIEQNKELAVELSASREKMKAERAAVLREFNYEGTSGGTARFTLCGVRFDADVYDNSVGKLGAQRIEALHKFMDLLTTDCLALDRYVEEKVRAEHRKTCPKFGAQSEIYGNFQCKRCEELHND